MRFRVNSVKGKQKQKENKECRGRGSRFIPMMQLGAIKRAEEKMTEDELNAKQV